MMVRKLLIATGILIMINGAFLCAVSNFNLGVILTVVFALFFLAWGIFYGKISELTQKGIPKIIKNILFSLMIAELLLVCFITIYGQHDNVKYDEDAVVVLGAGLHGDKVSIPLKLRLDAAIEYNAKNPDALIVVTGGQGFQESVTEASAMEKYLIEKGIEKERIIKEEKATSTNENMKFSKKILDTYFDEEYKIAVVTNNFHIYRGVTIAKNEGFRNVSHIHAGLQWYNYIPNYLRESLAVIKMWLIDMI